MTMIATRTRRQNPAIHRVFQFCHQALRWTWTAVFLKRLESSVSSSVFSLTSCSCSPRWSAASMLRCIACLTSATWRRVSCNLSKPYFCTSFSKTLVSRAWIWWFCASRPNSMRVRSLNGTAIRTPALSSLANLSEALNSGLAATQMATTRDLGLASVSSSSESVMTGVPMSTSTLIVGNWQIPLFSKCFQSFNSIRSMRVFMTSKIASL
mmetsp:Transcript_2349/g.4518  ORF Transcript_2349/g.4518 Transcript_2349/m.4518 type:complete len:210 (-) Transcript_2349:269-898(-)